MLSKIKIAIISLFIAALPSGLAFAQYTSNNYKVNETFFGAGGDLQDQSNNYQAKTSVGELGVGNVSSPHFQAYAGFNTTNTVFLDLRVNGGTFDLGILDTSQAKAVTTTFTVEDYLSNGYTVQLLGNTPTNTSHQLTPMSTAGSSQPGTEQFGINLAANNLSGIGVFGAGPAQLPDSTFGFGSASSPYNTSNVFKYVDGDTIASSSKSSGVTQYTLSMIANVSQTTPGGAYGTSMYIRAIPEY